MDKVMHNKRGLPVHQKQISLNFSVWQFSQTSLLLWTNPFLFSIAPDLTRSLPAGNMFLTKISKWLTLCHPKFYMSCLHSLVLKVTCFSIIPFRVVRKCPNSLGFCVVGMKHMKGLLGFPSFLPRNERQRTFKMFHQIQQTLFKMSRFHREVGRLRGKKVVRRSNPKW